jgi:type IX secretion system PorP/SprF family membrane protein
MKKSVCFLIINVLIISIMAQSNIRLNNYWDKTYFINPASINDLSLAEFNMATRKQWVGFPGSPATLFASATTYLENMHTQFGLKIVQDKIGYTNSTAIDLTYAYSLLFQREWKLHLGLAVSYQNLSYDMSSVIFPTADDPTIYERLLNESNFNSTVGVELTSHLWKVGASSQNLFSLFYNINKQFPNTNFVYVMYKQYSHDYVNLGYGVTGIQYNNLLQMELNLTGYFKITPQTDAFQLGVFYRTRNEMGVILGVDLTKAFHLSYSYDFNVGGISRSSVGTHELMLSYKLPKEWKCKNCWY